MGKLHYLDRREWLVERAESIVERVKDGRVKGLAYILVNQDNSVTVNWLYGPGCDSSFLCAGIGDLQHQLHAARDGISETDVDGNHNPTG